MIFDDASVAGLVERVLPDVLVKAAQYSVEEVVGHEIVRATAARCRRAHEAGLFDQRANREDSPSARQKTPAA